MAGILSDLFDEGDDSQGASGPSEGTERLSVERANPPRNETKLCGLANQGATCYLNALLQTLHFTPEFRQELFKLRSSEIGTCSPDTNKHEAKSYRLIPIQLQRLSARLLLAEEQCISTAFLTDSFGWSDNEELFQHDVDEMNRILFNAIEVSLTNTSGSKIISTLYHGNFVNRIKCQNCGVCREIKEDFQHIPVTVVGLGSLQESLQKQFIQTETLEGDNKYHCGACDQLVDAVKGCRLTHLPPILSIALMRFQYDFAKNERYKETKKFSFPQLLDMSPFVEDPDTNPSHYELFSVLIHGGSTYGGHYKAYIRDIQDLGNWVRPEEEKILVPASKEDRNPSGYSEYSDPVALIASILLRIRTPAAASDICEALRTEIGITWSQRFKPKYGTFMKFIKKHPETFAVSEGQKVSLHAGSNHISVIDTSPSKHSDASMAEENSQSSQTNGNLSPMDISLTEPDSQPRPCPLEESPASKKLKRQNSTPPPPGYRWFEFNDRCVRPIHEKSISTMFGGKESAYMLFYRRADVQLPPESMGRPDTWLQDSWTSEVAEYNRKLERTREEYELHLNSICVHVHYAATHCFVDGILQHVPENDNDTTGCLLTITVDRRQPISALHHEIIAQSRPDLLPEEEKFVLHEIKDLPAGFHLYDQIPLEEDCDIKKHVSDNDHVFVWNGQDIHGSVPPVGADSEPVMITLTYPDPASDLEQRDEETPRQKNTLLSDLRTELLLKSGIPASQAVLSMIRDASYEGSTRSKKSHTPFPLPPNKDTMTLAELGVENGSQVIAEKKGKRNISYQEAAKRSKMLHLRIEDRCTPIATLSTPWRAFTVDICFDEAISTLKQSIVEKLNPADLEEGCRIRLEDESKGLTPPVHEDQTLKEAGVKQNQKIVLEKGDPPTSTQITISYHISPISDDLDPKEIVVEQTASVGECLAVILSHANLSDGWHLRKTNWCCEASAVLEDEEQTLEDANVRDGNYLLVEEGRLPPKGYIRLPIYRLIPFPDGVTPDNETRNQELQELETKIDEFLANVSKKDVKKSPSVNIENGVKPEEQATPQQNETSTPNNGSSYTPKERDLFLLHPPLTHALNYIDQIDISQADTVDDLKAQVLTLSGLSDAPSPIPSCLRMQEIVGERPQRVFKDGKQTLKKLKISSGTNIAITTLDYDEVFPNSCLLLRMALHSPASAGQFLPTNELVFDTSDSSSPTALLKCLSQRSNIPLEYLRAAKHRMERFDWTTIREAPASSGRKGKNRKNKTPPPKPSVRNPPINLKDNEFIGVKDIRLEPEEALAEWYMEWDNLGLKFLKALQEEKKRKRREKKGGDVFNLGGSSRSKRPERIPYIFVGDYENSELMDTNENGISCLDENFDGNVS